MNSNRLPSLAWSVVTVLVCLEAIGLVVLFGYTIVGFANRGDDSLMAAISILIVAAVSAFWAGATFLALSRRRRWARSSALTIQIFIIAVAVGAFQGIYAQPLIGWALLIPALVAGIAALIASLDAAPRVEDIRESDGVDTPKER